MQATSRIVVIGAGGQGLVVVDALLAEQDQGASVEVVACLDDDPTTHGRVLLGVTVTGPVAALATTPHEAVIVAVGNNAVRERLSASLMQTGETLATVCHPSAVIGRGVQLGAGTMVSARAVVVTGARIGRGVLLNTGCIIEHDTVVEDFAHVSPGTIVGANVAIGTRTLVGMGATVLSGLRIGRDTVVGAGAVVVRDLADSVVAVGVPARSRPHR